MQADLDHSRLTLGDNDQSMVKSSRAYRRTKPPTGYENLGRLLQLSFTFFILFCAFFTTQNLTTFVLSSDGYSKLGYYILATLYLSIAVGSLISTAIVKKIGVYKCLILGGFGHFSFVFASTFPAYKYDHQDEDSFITSKGFIGMLLLLSALLNGLGASVIWVAEGSYIASCAIPKTRGFFYGMFWMFYQSS